MELTEKQIILNIDYLKDFLDIKWDSHYLYKFLSKSPKNKKLAEARFGKGKIKSWSNSTESKSSSPGNSDEFLEFAYMIDMDPFLFYKINYRSWSVFLKSMDGNILIGETINFGEIIKSLKFIDYFFAPSINYPSKKVIENWEKSINKKTKHEIYCYEFESDLQKDEKEEEQRILIKPSNFDNGQVIHFGYNKDKPIIGYDSDNKPIRMYDFWQEYKFIYIRKIIDVQWFLDKEDDWNEEKRNINKYTCKKFREMKEGESFSDFKKRAINELFIVLIINIIGGIEYELIKKDDSFLMKTRFQEPKTKFKVYSLEKFDLKLVGKKVAGVIEIYENPC